MEGNSKRFGIFLLGVCLFVAPRYYLTPAFAQKILDPDEVEILRQIHTKYKLNLWNFSVDPCSGQGSWKISENVVIECDCNTNTSNDQFCHISKILLKSQNINGELPEEFANLPSLSHIELNRNNFHGNIPPSWASLNLTFLSVIGNNLTGQLPEWVGNITSLEILLLESNMFSGSIPYSLGSLSFLKSLLLSCNQFTGNIPSTLGKLTNLKDFRIDGNDLCGIIPTFFVKWTKLERLYMQGTSLKGPFPLGFSSLSNISELRVTDINISGTFPPLQNMKFEHLTIRNCQLSGPLPEYIGDMKDLTHLDLSFNSFTGKIPRSYEKLKNYSLDILLLTRNNLSGEIPNWFDRMFVDFSYNLFTGPKRVSCQDQEKNLVASLAPNTSRNDISPCLLRSLPCLKTPMNYELFINCGGQAVTIDNRTYVANTQSSSPSHFYESSDKKWGFSSTGFFEGIKGDKYTFNYTTTNKSSLLGTRNEKLYTSARLNPLSLKYYGFCFQKGSYIVSLHFAEIMFTDDDTVSSNGRRIFDVSIQGRKVLKNFDISKTAGGVRKGIVRNFNTSVENGTLEIHFQWLGKGTQQVPVRGVYGPLISAISVVPNFEPYIHRESDNLSTGKISGIVVGLSAFFALLVLILLFLWQRKKLERSAEFKELEKMTGYFNLGKIKSATQNFASENKIGEGGFGPVYKGELKDGTLIAVKQLSSKSRQGNREFLNEIGMISALQHPNLVKLFGCSVEGNQLMVIYEYMKNNSLASALFGKGGMKMNLDWPTRYKIIQDVARGLAYLHEESIIKIVHRDIKASNILLDKNLNAKISDFGLAKLNEEEDTHISTRIAGTVGYMAPEYAMRGYLTEKADVYSFGIVVLEILSGKSNAGGFIPKEDCFCLLDWANVLRERKNTIQLIDPIINQYIKETHQMLNLVFWCTNQSPSLRPLMSTIVSMLEGNASLPTAPMKDERTEGTSESYNAFEDNCNENQLLEAPCLWSTFSSMLREEEYKEDDDF